MRTRDLDDAAAARRGIAAAAAAAVAFGTLAIFAKFGYRADAEVVPLLAGRFWVTSVLLAAFHAATRRPLGVPRGTAVRLLLLGGIGYAAESGLFFAALERAPAGVVSLIFYSYPMLTTLLAWATGLERLRAPTIVALALGSGGIALIFGVPSGGLAGPLLALAAAAAVGVFMVTAQVVVRGVAPAAAATWTAAGAAIVLSGACLAGAGGLPAAALPAAGGLGLATAVAFLLMYTAIARIGSTRTSVAAMLEPVTTLALAALVLDERLTARVLLGAALVVAALPVLATTARRSEPPRDAL